MVQAIISSGPAHVEPFMWNSVRGIVHVEQCTHYIDAYGLLDGGWEPKHTQQDWIELAFSLSLNWTQSAYAA